jgi:hypothetical protein
MILPIHRTAIATADTVLHDAANANEGGRIVALGRSEARRTQYPRAGTGRAKQREGATTGRDRVRPARPGTVKHPLAAPIHDAG